MSYNVLSKEGLIVWLERQPGDTSYDYQNLDDCLAARYFHAHDLGHGGKDGYPMSNYMPRINGNFREQIEYVALKARHSNYEYALEIAGTLP